MEVLMKRIRLNRWATHIQPPRNPRLPQQTCQFSGQSNAGAGRVQQRGYHLRTQWQQGRRVGVEARRRASTLAANEADAEATDHVPLAADEIVERPSMARTQLRYVEGLQAPSHLRANQSGKLSALHARLSLPAKLPLQTLARCLIDASVDPRPGYNNAPLALLGQDLLGLYTTEHLLCHYPRLPLPVLFAAQYAYVGPATLGAMRGEWGVEVAAAPGQEVDPGLLQLKRVTPGNALSEDGVTRLRDMPSLRRLGSGRRNEAWNYRRGMASRVVYDDQFGDLQTGLPDPDTQPYPGAPISTKSEGPDSEHTTAEESALNAEAEEITDTDAVTVEAASASFIRALAGALHLHAGPAASKLFHREHILSRHLQLHTLFNFTHPTRDLSRLCAREDFEPPVARLISETGRLSRSPVFVVGVYSGEDKLGEGAGSSLNEARVRAAAAALRSWYLYSPTPDDIVLPSDMEVKETKGKKKWKAQMIDVGEVVT